MARGQVFADNGLELGRSITVAVTKNDLVARVHPGPAAVIQLQLGMVAELIDTGEHQIAAFRLLVSLDQGGDVRQRHAATGIGLLCFLDPLVAQAGEKVCAFQLISPNSE